VFFNLSFEILRTRALKRETNFDFWSRAQNNGSEKVETGGILFNLFKLFGEFVHFYIKYPRSPIKFWEHFIICNFNLYFYTPERFDDAMQVF
jgi:hypothetical protein